MSAGAKKTGIVIGVKKKRQQIKLATAGIVQSKNGGSDAVGPKKPFISKIHNFKRFSRSSKTVFSQSRSEQFW